MFRRWRCWFRLYHDWSRPEITQLTQQTRIVHVCKRCGKKAERYIPNR